jgi:hypothetical protein
MYNLTNDYLTEKEVCTLFKFSTLSELHLAVEENKFPRPVKIKRKKFFENVYLICDIEQLVREREEKIRRVKEVKRAIVLPKQNNSHNRKRQRILIKERIKIGTILTMFLVFMYFFDQWVKQLIDNIN